MKNFYTIINPQKTLNFDEISEILSIYDDYPWFGLCRLVILKYKQQTKAEDFSKYFAFTILSVDNQNIDNWLEESYQLPKRQTEKNDEQ